MNSTLRGAYWDGHKLPTMVDKVVNATLKLRMKRLMGESRGPLVFCEKCAERFSEHLSNPKIVFEVFSKLSCKLCDLRLAKERSELTKSCETFLWEYPQSNDEAYWKLADVLQIRDFADLDPTPAHYYLAFLVREGLISELVTTNYDCNLERAYLNTWLGSQTLSSNTVIRRIYDLDTFAESAALNAEWHPGEDTPHILKAYKINGCAAQLKECCTHAADILLTASQLQDWRKRKWAADFFRTKVRSAALVTIGFGSDEPQVVHTLQQVLEEFSGLGLRNDGQPQPLYEAANAPVVTTYEHNPSFQQMQLVYGFSTWWSGIPTNGADLVLGPYQRAKSLTSSDEPETVPDCLPADDLWRDIFQAVYARLVSKKLRAAAISQNAAFTAAVPDADRLLVLLAAQLDSCTESQLTNPGSPPHWLVSLESTDDPRMARRPWLTRCLTHIRLGSTAPTKYCAINDHSSLIAEMALIFELLQIAQARARDENTGIGDSSHRIWDEVSLAPDARIEVRSSGVGGTASFYISRNTQPSVRQFDEMICESTPVQRLELVVGAAGAKVRQLGERRIYLKQGSEIVPVVITRVDWRALFPTSTRAGSIAEAADHLADAISFPTKYRRRLDLSIRRNPSFERRI
ncbi:SIR2-like domain-containing protein [Burkholderia sp. WP9]|uniref:SIR2 family protein n=1 Tax=Burkholderia sp. WP9 TaxID=1500263 RepID=UPI000896717B|nr:SIR2 family protein [Burkholderia sp. WP9]SEC94731.1 SIR2-like domain-containing protein [Burkholderia sp. WP9]